MVVRSATLKRETRETGIEMTLVITGKSGKLTGTTGIGFFDHMLNSFCVHGGFEITLDVRGDLYVDAHHTVEDTGIVLGMLFGKILGGKKGIKRYGFGVVPMDEALAQAVADISGRPYLVFNCIQTASRTGDYDTQLTEEFMRALAFNMGATLHIKAEYGVNQHHITEAIYKAVARAVREATEQTGDDSVLSAKGVL